MAGDVFQLGNASYRIQRVERGSVRVEDAHGLPPSIPFWLGEAPSRSDEVSLAVSRLREEIEARLDDPHRALAWLTGTLGLQPAAGEQIVDYYAAARAALTRLPTQRHLVFERFFDESGGTQLIIHSPYGSRINRAWGLSLRKRFCRKFNFELQAAATEDAIILSLTATHSFPLDEPARYLRSDSVRELLVQALLDAPMFITRWRWNAGIALALLRFRGGNKVPPQLQRMEAEDLIAAVFPDQLACLENIVGDREIPDHPLVQQTIHDCLHEAMDIDGLERLLRALEAGSVDVTARDLPLPSMLALEVLAARPYAFLDDAPLEERRTQAVMARRWLDPETAADLGRLDPEAIARVQREAWPQPETADEMYEALALLGYVTEAEAQANLGWARLLRELAQQRRAARLLLADAPGPWVAVERLAEWQAVLPQAGFEPPLQVPSPLHAPSPPASNPAQPPEREAALVEIVRGRLEGVGPTTAAQLAAGMQVRVPQVDAALLALEAEGFAMRGQFGAVQGDTEWCDRRLLARINRYTVKRLRDEIEPVSAADFMRFLLRWQHVLPGERMEGPDAVAALVSQLEGYEAAAAGWEAEILPARVRGYDPAWLDDLCLSGRVLWTRLEAPRANPERERGVSAVRGTPITLLTRKNLSVWAGLVRGPGPDDLGLSARARAVADYLSEHGASFFDDIVHALDLPRTFVEEALGELVGVGLVNSDGFSGLRALLLPSDRRKPFSGSGRRRAALPGVEDAGRWALIRRRAAGGDAPPLPRESIEQIARTLLRRYGVVFWRVLAREAEWLPPWRDLLLACRRLEARGEIRGGRFVAGFSGEQFALPEAVGALRGARREGAAAEACVICGADPLNLAGFLTPGKKVPALHGNRLLLRDGLPVAAWIAGEAHYFEPMSPEQAWEARNLMLRTAAAHAGVAASTD
jgi:ATP-dependent Lhr-like helicase